MQYPSRWPAFVTAALLATSTCAVASRASAQEAKATPEPPFSPVTNGEDVDSARIKELVARGAAKEAVPVALARAFRLRDDPAAWLELLTIAEWSSDAGTALEALEHLVALLPENREYRFKLAQRLLWAKRTADALPHARWLAGRAEESDPAALETTAWILLGEHATDEAQEVLERWIAAAPTKAQPRWILADLTHWSARWRDASAQYDALAQIPDAAADPKLAERVELLRHDHPGYARVSSAYWYDNVGVSFAGVGVEANVQMPARIVLTPRADLGAWQQDDRRASGGAAPGKLLVTTFGAGVRFELSDAVQPEIGFGYEADDAGHLPALAGQAAAKNNGAGFASAGLRLSVGGWLFGKVWAEHDRFRVSLEAARQDIRASGGRYTLYAEPLPWMFLSSEAALQYLSSDDNRRVQGTGPGAPVDADPRPGGNTRRKILVAAGVHNVDPLQIEPRVFAQYDGYAHQRYGAVPYFTPTEPASAGGDVTLRYTVPRVFRAEASMGVVVQQGVVALRPGVVVQATLWKHLQVGGAALYIGSPQYNQVRFDGNVGYLF